MTSLEGSVCEFYEHILALVQEHGIGSLHPHPDGGIEVVTRDETAGTEPDRAA